jgi:hypothetical protein
MRALLLPAAMVMAVALGAVQDDPDEAPQPRPVGIKDGPPKGGPEEPKEKEKESRLSRLKKLSHDRRPSAILKAWAPPAKTDRPQLPKEPLDEEIAAFQKNVTLGKWAEVKAYLASLPDEEAIAAYEQVLQSLRQTPSPLPGTLPPGTMPMPGAMQFAERNSFTVEDVLGLAAAAPQATNPTAFAPRAALAGVTPVAALAPTGITKEYLSSLSSILREATNGGTLPEVVVARFKVEVAKPAEQAVITRRQAAKLLADAGHPQFIGDFLPTPEEAQKAGDLEALNLLSRHFLARHSIDAQAGNLEKAWAAVQAVLAVQGGTKIEQEEALLRAVELAPRLEEKLGQTWLNESFTKDPERGMRILVTVGTLVSQGLSSRPHSTDERLNALKLARTAVDALLKSAPERAKEWRPTLTLLAIVWIREAEFSRQHDQSSNDSLRRDRYGNFFFYDDEPRMMQMPQRPDMPQAIPVAELIKTVPGKEWIAAVDDSVRPRLAGIAARLHLKANEEDKAFPLIEQLAEAHPAEARELVREFLRVWTQNHDMNAARNSRRYSWFFYAFEQRAEGIPLTRSKQERNLRELAGWSPRIRKLPGNADLDEEMLVRAFTACHSSAEVYKTEAIELVFGPLEKVRPRTLGALANQMRENLAGLWKDPNVQARQKTNRKKKDIEVEVLRGYEVAQSVVSDGLKKFPDHWALLAAQAGLLHDEINFRQELAKSSDFAPNRSVAFAIYHRAAASYAKALPTMTETEFTTTVYEQWFAAGLGAVDLGMITEEKQPDWKQPPLIRAAILALPGELAEKHMAKFANNLFIRMSGAKPHVKFNYLKAGFQIVGDHKQAVEAKKLFDYYKDLVTELQLDVRLDGPADVGHGRPFGVFVNLRHTRDIERESGGFGRYLQNQNSMLYAYNYGRPTTDYRDRFEAAARAALKEHFEVVSVTFQDEKVSSRADREFGWRYTPYAYLLLKPRGPQVDKLPPLRLDLDFLDTSGFVVLPIESPPVLIDCRDRNGSPRPLEKLTVTQTLDERQADKGVLLLEIKATGVGLIPDLDDVCIVAPDGFEVSKVEDQQLAVKKFDDDADRNAVLSERVWLITLKAHEGQATLPKTFRFPAVKLPTKEVVYQRYVDADLAAVPQEVALEREYGTKSRQWVWWTVGGGVLLLLAAAAVLVLVLRRKPVAEVGSGLPERIDPFIAIALLRDVRERSDLSPAQLAALDRDITDIEQHFFAADRNGAPAPEIRRIVERWVGQVRPRAEAVVV